MPETHKTRREMLEGFLAANPNDAFARYGLAIECGNQGDFDAAVSNFKQLIAAHPDYVTGYFQFAQLLARISRNDEARQVLQQGMEAAHRAGNSHARDEMEEFLRSLD